LCIVFIILSLFQCVFTSPLFLANFHISCTICVLNLNIMCLPVSHVLPFLFYYLLYCVIVGSLQQVTKTSNLNTCLHAYRILNYHLPTWQIKANHINLNWLFHSSCSCVWIAAYQQVTFKSQLQSRFSIISTYYTSIKLHLAKRQIKPSH
jgi:hypothetical protein